MVLGAGTFGVFGFENLDILNIWDLKCRVNEVSKTARCQVPCSIILDIQVMNNNLRLSFSRLRGAQ